MFFQGAYFFVENYHQPTWYGCYLNCQTKEAYRMSIDILNVIHMLVQFRHKMIVSPFSWQKTASHETLEYMILRIDRKANDIFTHPELTNLKMEDRRVREYAARLRAEWLDMKDLLTAHNKKVSDDEEKRIKQWALRL